MNQLITIQISPEELCSMITKSVEDAVSNKIETALSLIDNMAHLPDPMKLSKAAPFTGRTPVTLVRMHLRGEIKLTRKGEGRGSWYISKSEITKMKQ